MTVFAANDPDVSGGSDVNGYVDTDLAISDLQVTSSGGGSIPVDLYVPYGTLSMATTTGLVFNTSTTGSHLNFEGSLANVNAGLASLHYRSDRPKSIQLSISITGSNQVYNPTNGHLYQVIDVSGSPLTANQARTAASGQTLDGLQGYLVTITSQEENDFVQNRVSADSWIGASDTAEEGKWIWDTGPESGTQFWQGLYNGQAVSSRYNNWANGEPNGETYENCGEFYSGNGYWNDLPCDSSTLSSYIVEYGDTQNQASIASKTVNINVTYPPGNTTNVNACQQLVDIAADPLTYRYDTINITQDLDCEGATLAPMFNLIDEDAGRVNFRGTLNGNGHTISNFTISTNEGYFGLVGDALDATIENITLSNETISTSNSCVGGLVGNAENTDISHVTLINASVSGSYSVGGVAGCYFANSGSHSASDNSFSGSVSAQGYAGGMIGDSENENSALSIINNVVDDADISGSYAVGGVIGEIDNSGSDMSAHVDQNNVTGTVTGSNDESIGGLIGYAYADDGATFTNSSNTVGATVSSGYYVGGLAGTVDIESSGTSYIANGNTINSGVSGSSEVAGMVGYAYLDGALSFTIANNSVTSDVSGNASVAGLVGDFENYYSQSINVSDNQIAGTISSSESSTGSLVGYLYQNGLGYDQDPSILTFTRNSSSSEITTDGTYTGGFIGYIDAYYHTDLTINQSYFNGSIDSSSEDVGGMIGYLYNESYDGDTAVHLIDNYVNAGVTGTTYVGGAVGYADIYSEDGDSTATLDMQRLYTYGGVTGDDYVGGVLGYSEQIDDQPTVLTLKDSFTAAQVNSGPESYSGALVGYFDQGENTITSSGNYYDANRVGFEGCSGNEITLSCSAVNTDGTEPNYFKIDNTRAPLTHWNFASVWGFNDELNDGFPCLQNQEGCTASVDGDNDGVSNAVENAGPNSGDANNDGTPDSQQANVASFVDEITGQYVALAVDDQCNIQSVGMSNEGASESDAKYTYPAGLMTFTLDCGEAGFTATINQYYYGVTGSDFVVRKFKPGTGYFTVDSATTSDQTIDGNHVKLATYQVTDGSNLDLDGASNGTIEDPAGLAVADGSSTLSDLASTGQRVAKYYLIASILIGPPALIIAYTLIRRRSNKPPQKEQ